MKKLKLLSFAVCAALLMGTTAASASNTKVEAEEFTIYSYCPETGEEKYVECDTSFVVDQINNGATHVSTPSFSGKNCLLQNQMGNEVSPNDIIGGYDSRYKINNTTIPPYSSICLIRTVWKNGAIGENTGCMIGTDTVLTAGHCVQSSKEGGEAFYISVIPGNNGTTKPYGTFYAKTVYVHPHWKNGENDNYDWAVIKLADTSGGNDTQIGDETGYLGLDYFTTGSLNGISVWLTGYPWDCENTMWRSGGEITNTLNKLILFSCDAEKGESGAPVTTLSNKIIGLYTGNYNINENRGIRVTPELISLVVKMQNGEV